MRIYTVVKCLLTTVPVLATGLVSFAQDTTKKKTIDITSSFKPVLKEGSKINFNAAPPVADTSRPRLNYNIPSQNLLFSYVPTELKPVAVPVDTGEAWKYSNYIKVGVGNVHLPYVKAGFSFGDGKNTFYNVYGEHYSSKGDLPFQKNSMTSVGGAITYKTQNNHEWNGGLGFKSDDYFFYGYQPSSLVFTKDQLRQRFQTIDAKVNFRNTVPSEFGLTYNPSLKVSVFRDNHSPTRSEANTVVNVPITKSFGETFGFRLGVTADLTNHRRESGNSTQNNLFLVSPAVTAKTPNLYINAGITPSWDQAQFHMLPNVTAELTTDDQRFTFMAGWIGYYNKGNCQNFAAINPWINMVDTIGMKNDRVVEFYGGIKGSLGDHFTYLGKVGVQSHNNMVLFVNDALDGKTFQQTYEPSMNVLQIHGEVGYTVSEKFSAKGAVTFNNFTGLDANPKAYGQLPRELNLSLKYRLLKDLWLTSELWSWDGAYYRQKPPLSNPLQNIAEKGDAAFDLNFGAEFKITKNFNLWLQLNNIFNNKYERWNQYEVFGFNILGGITYSF
ncbi:MAG: hypothetical protein EOO02_00815 [Chitinophagaceae bacterium]|nr:MAG: hypothetical protein EOO02_00815 [Chitinophagaceae bacterium]